MKFENEWLSRYTRPLRCIHDQGTEFTSLSFQHILTINGIQDVRTTVVNPQA
jgi:transposase InsO family protein